MRSSEGLRKGRSARRWRGAAARCAFALGTASCARSHAPGQWLPDPGDVAGAVNGAWIEVSFVQTGAETQGPEIRTSEGEFLAAGAESVYVLTERGVDAVARAAVKSARVDFYQSQADKGVAITVLGFLSTLSHGVGMVFTGPLWIITGSVATASISREHLRDVPRQSWEEAAIYARFPQGLPETFDRNGLRFDPGVRPKREPRRTAW